MSLTLFKNITEELTDLEKGTLVPMLLNTLQVTHSGNRIKSRNLCGWFTASRYNVTDVRIRKMVNYIRVTNAAKPKVLIGASTGYFLTGDIQTVDDQIESMQGRVDSMLAVIDAMKAQRENLKNS
jgi:hypothetical protein